MRPVVVTGIGVVSPVGVGHRAFWQSLVDGTSQFANVSRFDASSYPCQIGAEVSRDAYEPLVDPRRMRSTTLASQFALVAAELAVRDAHLPQAHYEPHKFGVVVGTAIGGWSDAERQVGILLERGARRVNPFIASGAGNHSPGIEVAAALGARGAQATFSSGCASSAQAIAYGAALVQANVLDACLVGGTEAPLTPLTFAALCRTQELCVDGNDPRRASRPFDRRHSGMVLSEGSCFLLLETREGAGRRSAPAYAEVKASASSCDAQGLHGIDVQGEAGARAIHDMLVSSCVDPAKIDYVCAHANSLPAFDHKEVVVLKKAFGEFAVRLPVSSIKAVLGHPFGASGAFQTAAATLAIHHQLIPPTHNLEEPDPMCDLDCVPGVARRASIRTALVSSYGYGGLNAYLLLAEP